MRGLGEYRWEGYSLREKQRWMREGQGPSAVDRGVELLGALAGSCRRSEENVRRALGELGVDWSGAAADSANSSLGGAVSGAARVAERAAAGSAGLSCYGDSFAQAKRTIPAYGEIDGEWSAEGFDTDLSVVSGLQSDLRAGPAALRRADLAVNAALRAHEQATRDALATFTDVRAEGRGHTMGARAESPAASVLAPVDCGTTSAVAGPSLQPTMAEQGPTAARAVSAVVQLGASGWHPTAGSTNSPTAASTSAPTHAPPAATATPLTAPATTRPATVSQAAEPSEPTGRGEAKRSDNAAPPIAPMPPLPPPMGPVETYRTATPRYSRPVDPVNGPFGRPAVPEGCAAPNGLLGATGRREVELPRKAPSIPGLAPPGSLDGPDPRGSTSGGPLSSPVGRPLPPDSTTQAPPGSELGRWRADRAGAARSSDTEQSFDDHSQRVPGDEFPPVHGLGRQGERR